MEVGWLTITSLMLHILTFFGYRPDTPLDHRSRGFLQEARSPVEFRHR